MYFNVKEQRRIDIISKFLDGKIDRGLAQSALNIKERQFRRIIKAYRERGLLSIKHGNCGKVPWNKTTQEIEDMIVNVVKDRFYDYNMSHALEKLKENNIQVPCYSVFRKICHCHKMVKHPYRKLKQKIRKIRNRCAARGDMLQIDGSYHMWFGRIKSCLIIILDDATGGLLFGKFCKAETKDDCIDVIKNVLTAYGIFGILYADKAGVYGGTKREGFAHVLRGLNELGITSIAANSAEAKGRIERMNKTLQDRLIPEMRTRRISTVSEANLFLQNEYIPEFNKKFAVAPIVAESNFKKLSPKIDLEEVFCSRYDRRILQGHRFSFGNRQMLIETKNLKYSLIGRDVEIRVYNDRPPRFVCNGIDLTIKEFEKEKNMTFQLYAKLQDKFVA